MLDSAELPRDAIERALAVEPTIEAAWRWATDPITDAEVLAQELAELAERRDLPHCGLRALTQLALGGERTAVVEPWLERDSEVLGVLGRVRTVAMQLEGLPSRARIAARQVMALALGAPVLARAAAAEVWRRGPGPDRDPMLRTLEHMPLVAKQRAEDIRAEATIAATLAQRAKEGILAGLRARARHVARTDATRTDRLAALPRTSSRYRQSSSSG